MEIRGNNESNHLILKYNDKINKFEDITSKVIYIKKDDNSWFVVFDSRQTYHIKLHNIKVSDKPTLIDIYGKNIVINDKKVYVSKIIKFERLGYKVFFEKTTRYFSNINIRDNVIEIDDFDLISFNTGNKVFDYYKNLSKYASDISNDNMNIETLLYKLYERIKTINSSSVLYSYTTQTYDKKPYNNDRTIYPFSTNNSQNKAIYNTFSNKLSVIAGPPGTGKTQVILNIIANALYSNKTVAVISNNNTAVENVYLKMKEYDLDFLLAYLGNKNNVDRFFLNKVSLSEKISNFKTCENKIKLVSECNKVIENLNKYTNDIKLIEYKINTLELEQKHFNEKKFCIDELEVNVDNYRKLLELQKYLISIKKVNFINKRILKYRFNIVIKDYSDVERILLFLNRKSYQLQIDDLKKEKKEKEKYISDNNLEENIRLLKKYSLESLEWYLYVKYHQLEEQEFDVKTYKDKFKDFTYRYPVTLSTTHSLLRNCPDNFLYDLVIIDEASQSDILTSLITMNVARSMVIIGDDKQLSQIDNQEIYDFSDKLAEHYQIPKYYQYKNNSILESAINLPSIVVKTLLREHYRCEFRIIDFCNKKFYDNQLIICTKKSEDDSLCIVHTVEGNHARKNPNGSGQYNDREAQEILKIISENNNEEIGIITPFRAQADYILDLIKDKYPNVEVDTVHKFQGRQKDIIILSTVVNDLNDAKDELLYNFITNPKLLNVAISRAISKLYLVVSDNVYKSNNNNIANFIDYIKYNSTIGDIKGNITSIFDELYKQNYQVIKNSRLYKKVDSYAEELMLNLLEKILIDYPNMSVSLHVNLSFLVSDLSGFTNEEIEYIKHPWTHVDFVIFDNITFKHILCIELDGTAYHDYSRARADKDKIKTAVLEKNGLKLLRIRTNKSKEEEKIREALKTSN